MRDAEDRLSYIETKSDLVDRLRWVFTYAPDGFEEAAELVGYSPAYSLNELNSGLKKAIRRIFGANRHIPFVEELDRLLETSLAEFETGDEVEARRVLMLMEESIQQTRP